MRCVGVLIVEAHRGSFPATFAALFVTSQTLLTTWPSTAQISPSWSEATPSPIFDRLWDLFRTRALPQDLSPLMLVLLLLPPNLQVRRCCHLPYPYLKPRALSRRASRSLLLIQATPGTPPNLHLLARTRTARLAASIPRSSSSVWCSFCGLRCWESRWLFKAADFFLPSLL